MRLRLLVAVGMALCSPRGDIAGQTPAEAEVLQIFTFSFLPGKTGEALALFRDRAVPLYRADSAMRSFHGFREVESPIPLDLMVVSAFRGMAGMDASNARLRVLAEESGTSIGAIYGGIAALSAGHIDQFVEMLPTLGSGDPSSTALTAVVWYRLLPGRAPAAERGLATIAAWERTWDIPSGTGRFLVSDGWHYLRFLGFASLGAYHDYWSRMAQHAGHQTLERLTVLRREVIVASIPELAVRRSGGRGRPRPRSAPLMQIPFYNGPRASVTMPPNTSDGCANGCSRR